MNKLIALGIAAAAVACRPEPGDPIAAYLRLPDQPYAYTPDLPAHFAQHYA